MENVKFNEENRYKAPPSYHKNKSTLVNSLMSLGVGERLSAQILIIGAVIAILISFIVMYNLVTNTFSPITIPDIETVQIGEA